MRGLLLYMLAMCGRCAGYSAHEFEQFLMHVWALVTNHWQVFHQHKNGFVDQDVLDSYEARLHVTLKSYLPNA
jgi:hypothetical protein